MFNRQPFNRGKFNRSALNANSVLLYGDIELGVEAKAERMNATRGYKGNIDIALNATGKLNYSANLKGVADLSIEAGGQFRRVRSFDGTVEIGIAASGNIVRARHLQGEAVIALTITNEGFNTFRYETISLTRPGFLFRPGDELIIDMDNMTVTQNGQNVMRFVDRESEFFLFNPGNNEVTYQSTAQAGRVDLRILWKDAFR